MSAKVPLNRFRRVIRSLTASALCTAIREALKEYDGEAQAVAAVGMARAKAYEAGIKAMGAEIFGQIQVVELIGEKNIRVTPDFLIQGGSSQADSGALMIQALLAGIIKNNPNILSKKDKEINEANSVV